MKTCDETNTTHDLQMYLTLFVQVHGK